MSARPLSAIVLGGTAGVGRATVSALVQDGHRVGVIARGEARLDALAKIHGDNVAVAAADVGDAKALETAIATFDPDPDNLRIWINAAMATSFSPFDEMEIDEFDQILRTTLIGQVNGTRLALRHMTRGTIVNVGSGLSYRPVPLQSAYCAAKHGINGFTASVRSELIAARRPIEIALVQLPAINTPQFSWARSRLPKMPQPAPPIFAPEVAAEAIVRAARGGTRELLVGGSVLQLVFGDMVLPAYIDRRMARDGIEMQQSDRPDPGDRPDNLFGPVDHPAVAEGAFSDRAKDSGTILDADLARKLVFFGIPALIFALGLIIGLVIG